MVASVWEKRSIVHREGRLLSQPRVGVLDVVRPEQIRNRVVVEKWFAPQMSVP